MYYSQYKQDRFLNEVIFSNKKHGVFVEIGAHDGVSFSNTLFFEKSRKWNGYCIEPNPFVYENLKKNRTSKTFNLAVGKENTTIDFLKISGYGEMLSGVMSNYDERHLVRIDRDIAKHGGSKEVIQVKMATLESILEVDTKEIDLLSIDTEGSELEILQDIDFEKITIKVIVLENNFKSPVFNEFLIPKGYVLFSKLAQDEIYILNSYLSNLMKIRRLFFRAKTYMRRVLSKLNK